MFCPEQVVLESIINDGETTVEKEIEKALKIEWNKMEYNGKTLGVWSMKLNKRTKDKEK